MAASSILLFSNTCNYNDNPPFLFLSVTGNLFLLLIPGFAEYVANVRGVHELPSPSISSSWQQPPSILSVMFFVVINFIWYMLICVQSWQLELIFGFGLGMIMIICLVNPVSQHIILTFKQEKQDVDGEVARTFFTTAKIPEGVQVENLDVKSGYDITEAIHVTMAALLFLGMLALSIAIGICERTNTTNAIYCVMMSIMGFCLLFLLLPLFKPCCGKRVAWGARTNFFEIVYTEMFLLMVLLIPHGYPPP